MQPGELSAPTMRDFTNGALVQALRQIFDIPPKLIALELRIELNALPVLTITTHVSSSEIVDGLPQVSKRRFTLHAAVDAGQPAAQEVEAGHAT
jgi:hypothetical protein